MRKVFNQVGPDSLLRALFGLFVLISIPHSASALMLAPHSDSTSWERTLNSIPTPELYAFNSQTVENSFQPIEFSTVSNFNSFNSYSESDEYYYDVPREFRKYQNSHIAPIRIYSGCGAVAVGGVMMIAGYAQDTKYPWSGPYMSPSPLNVFGALIIAIGVGLIISGLIFYSKFKKHTIMPYNKSY